MKSIYRILLSIVLSILIGAGCYFWATGMIGSNFSFRSPLKDTPPTPGAPLGEASTHRVVIVLIDALRYDTSMRADFMPTLAQLREQGASAKMHSQPPSFSEPGYSTILTGAWPWVNDGPVFNLDYADIPTFTQDNLFSAAHRSGVTTAISGYYWFEKLVPQADVDQSFYTPGEDRAADAEVLAAALPWLQDDSAQLVLIHIDQVDYAGHHEGGASSIAWNEAANRADTQLAEIVATLDLSKDTIVVLSDHGQIDAGGHGGQDPIVLQEPFVIAGAGVKHGQYGDMNMVDVAPTLSALLGLNLPASAQGEVLTQMLNLDPSVTAVLPAAVEAQQTTLLTTYAKAIGQKLDSSKVPTGSDVSQYQKVMSQLRTNRTFTERIPRALLGALLLALVIFWLSKNIRKGAIAWIIGGFAFALLFNWRYAMLDGKTYSLSSVIGETELITYVAVTSALALLIVWLIIMLDQHYYKLTPGEATLKTFSLVFTVAFINGLPAILSFVLNGALLTWTLPNYLIEFLALLSIIEMLIISAAGLIFAGVTALTTWLVARKSNKKVVKKK
jgi:hypothetical protein